MLLLSTGALLLITVSISIGYALLSRFKLAGADLFENAFESYWLGLSALMIAATAAVCMTAVGTIGTPLLIGAGAAMFAWKPVRQFWAATLAQVTFAYAATAVLILLALSMIQMTPLSLPDTGFYHYQLIRWYSDYGAAPGMALLHHRLGFHSGMLALAAMLDHGLAFGRAGSIVNLASACLCLWFGGWKLNQAISAPSAKNLFWPFCLLVLATGLEQTLVSTYSDTLLAFFVPATFWIAWEWWDRGPHAQASWLILLLGAGGMTVKGSGLFLLAVAGILSLRFARISMGMVFGRITVSLLLITPTLAVQGISSGHPLFPMIALSLPVSWAMPDEMVAAARRIIRFFPMFGYDPPHPISIGEKARILLVGPRPSLYGIIAMTLLSAWLFWRKQRLGFDAVLALALASIGLLQLWQVPAARFCLGFLAVLPALIIAYHPRAWVITSYLLATVLFYIAEPTSNRLDLLRLLVYVGVLILLAAAFRLKFSMPAGALIALLVVFQFLRPIANAARNIPDAARNPKLILVPRPVAGLDASTSQWVRDGDVMHKENNDGFHCGSENPPCAPSKYQSTFLTINGLRYRCADHRLSCGFDFIK